MTWTDIFRAIESAEVDAAREEHPAYWETAEEDWPEDFQQEYPEEEDPRQVVEAYWRSLTLDQQFRYMEQAYVEAIEALDG